MCLNPIASDINFNTRYAYFDIAGPARVSLAGAFLQLTERKSAIPDKYYKTLKTLLIETVKSSTVLRGI